MTSMEELPVPAEYQEASLRFRWAWVEYKDKEKEVKDEIVCMVKILEDEGYSRTKAIQKIVDDHKDLKGFSRTTIYRELPNNIKRSYDNESRKEFYNNVSNVSNETFNKDLQNKDEEVVNITTSYDVKDAETFNDEIKGVNDIEDSEKQEDPSSLLVIDLPPPEPELQDPKITTFVGKLPKSVLRLAEKIELSPTKLELIANYSNKSILKDHRPIQETLVKEIAPLSIDDAKLEVAQVIRDLETGAIEKIEGQSSYIMDYNAREKIPKKVDRVKHPLEYFLQFQEKTFPEMMYILTGHKLTEDETFYEPKHVDSTEKHRQDMVNQLDERQKNLLYENAEVLLDAMFSLMDIIDGGSTTKL